MVSGGRSFGHLLQSEGKMSSAYSFERTHGRRLPAFTLTGNYETRQLPSVASYSSRVLAIVAIYYLRVHHTVHNKV
jgi:hypothetical protein